MRRGRAYGHGSARVALAGYGRLRCGRRLGPPPCWGRPRLRRSPQPEGSLFRKIHRQPRQSQPSRRRRESQPSRRQRRIQPSRRQRQIQPSRRPRQIQPSRRQRQIQPSRRQMPPSRRQRRIQPSRRLVLPSRRQRRPKPVVPLAGTVNRYHRPSARLRRGRSRREKRVALVHPALEECPKNRAAVRVGVRPMRPSFLRQRCGSNVRRSLSQPLPRRASIGGIGASRRAVRWR